MFPSRRSAFTLLEVIFALALSLLLFGALLSAVEMYRHLSTVGRQDVEQAQLSRAILRNFEIDLRSVVYREAEEAEQTQETAEPVVGTEGEEDADPDAEEQPAETDLAITVDAAAAFSGQSIGISGDATTLIIHASRPPGRLESLLPVERASDLKSIAYFLAVPGGAGLPGAAGGLLDADGTGEVQGLARLEGDRLAVEFADSTGNFDLLAEQTRLLAAEVDFLQFRYFDGVTWYEAWDSVAFGRLPNAVEITIGINSEAAALAVATTDSRESRLRRHVVALPTAIPYVAATQEVAQ